LLSYTTDKNKLEREKFAVCLSLAIAYSVSLGCMATLIGTLHNAIFPVMSEELAKVAISFAKWMTVVVPINALPQFILFLYLVRIGTKINNNTIFEEKTILLQNKIIGKMNSD